MLHNTRFGKNIFTRDLQEGEHILYVGHVHTSMLLKDFIPYLILGVITPVLFVSSNEPVAVLIGGVLGIASFIRFYIRFLLWYYDCWVITNKGIVDYYWDSIFSKKVIRIEYSTFDGIAHEIKGFWNTVLNKGNIQVVKSLDHHEVILRNASNPKHIEQMILHAQKAHELDHKVQKHASKQEMIQNLLAEMLNDYAKEKGIDLQD